MGPAHGLSKKPEPVLWPIQPYSSAAQRIRNTHVHVHMAGPGKKPVQVYRARQSTARVFQSAEKVNITTVGNRLVAP